MKLSKITSELEKVAPLKLAEGFDNVGLLVGNNEVEITKTLVALDTTEEVIDEAIAIGANLVIGFHPIIFSGLKSLTGKTYVERAVVKAIKHDINIYAIHTALDNAQYGVNHEICNRLGLKNTRALIAKPNQIQKLVTYVPNQNAETLKQALFAVGAGHIGNYDSCSFNLEGIGTFRAQEKANPFAGSVGELHTEEETMVNVVFHSHLKSRIIDALHKHHPYETPAYEIYALENTDSQLGMGRIGEFEQPMEVKEFMKFVKEKMNVKMIRYSQELKKPIKKVAVLGGSGAFAIGAAKGHGADAFITSDLKYHNFFEAENQILLMDIGHYESEQFTKELIVRILSEKFPNFATLISKVNTNPVNYF